MLVHTGGPRVLARRTAFGAVAVSAALAGLPAIAQAAPPSAPFISEIHYDDVGLDAQEFVEVVFPAGTGSTGWKVEAYNGSNGARYDVRSVPAPVNGVAVVDYTGLQNGAPDGLALVDPAGKVVEFISYEGLMTASNSTAAGMTSTDIGVSEDGVAEGYSLSRLYDPSADESFWDSAAPWTKGEANPTAPPVPDVCQTPATHSIAQVQGSGRSTPLTGQTVTVRGVVVGDLPSFGGFYVQDPAGDPNDGASDGIFVTSNKPVDLGDTVAVSGRPWEDFGQTEILARRYVSVCAEGDADDLPPAAALELPATDDQREPFEGMLVQPIDPLTVSEVFALTRFGELMLAEGGVLVQPTELARPGTPEAAAVAVQNAQRRIILDDGLDSGTSVTNRPYLSPATPVRVGDEVEFTPSPLVLGYGFGNWRLQPADGSAEGTMVGQNTRPEETLDDVGGDVQVAAFNVLNYFLTLGDSDVARGATTPEAFEKQAAKIVTAIGALEADVVTLMEIEDTDSTGYSPGNADAALADLVDRLNAAEGADVWQYVPLPKELYAVDRDVIRNGIIYRGDAVQAINKPVGLVDESVWFNAREPIAQLFKRRGGEGEGDRFFVVANHLKSKSNSTPPQSGTANDNVDRGQGAFNGDRTRQAASLADFVAELSSKKGEDDVLLMGDFNAYTQEDPMVVLHEAGYTDLGSMFDPTRYSYVFDSLSGSLDHAVATASLTGKVTGVAHWNINSVESFAYQYTGDPALYAADQFRSSDHDPLVLGLDLDE